MSFLRENSRQESCRVVLSVEVLPDIYRQLTSQAKRKKHAQENNETTACRHAAQIFAEMLGQVCHQQFYDNLGNDYQEVNSPLPSPVCRVVFVRILFDVADMIGIRGPYPSHENPSLLRQTPQQLSLPDYYSRSQVLAIVPLPRTQNQALPI
jgi:hypothetical protein